MGLLEILFYAVTAILAVLLLWSFVAKKRTFAELIAFAVVLVPLVLRVFRVK